MWDQADWVFGHISQKTCGNRNQGGQESLWSPKQEIQMLDTMLLYKAGEFGDKDDDLLELGQSC